MYSIPFEELRVTVRNRCQQILNGKTLRNPPSLNLYINCYEEIDDTVVTKVTCCLRYIHRECAAEQPQCPYCGTTWQLLSCCECNKPISIVVKYFIEAYNKYGSCVTLCCGAQHHPECTKPLHSRSRCPICKTPFDGILGLPSLSKDAWTLLCRHNAKRRHDYLRPTWKSTYDRYDYLLSVSVPQFEEVTP